LDLLTYPRLLRNLNRFFGAGLTIEQCRQIVRERMATRQDRFLQHARRYVYGYARSPYLRLLRHAGCEYGDLERLVRQEGLEPALERLRDQGVYVAFEEFKGRKPAVRGGATFHFTEADFDNPFRAGDLRVTTGASRSRGSPISVALNSLAENRVICFGLMLDAVGATQSPLITWLPGFPAGSGTFLWLGLSHIGRPPIRWFAVTDPARPTVTWRRRMIIPMARLAGRLHGLRLPEPEFTPLSEPGPVLEGVLDARRRYGEVSLVTTPSSGVRVAGLARASGVSLEGVRVFVGSEPLTPGKADEIRRSGATVHARYIFMEGGAAGVGCGDPEAPDDMHFLADSFALIRRRRPFPGVGHLDSYMFTSLLTYAPKVMLNTESDDFGDFTLRRCNCPLDALGLHHHFAYVRSFTKLTGEGITVLGTDCIRVLEEVLPREFGGASVDYQLLEAEDDHHITRLYLLINPSVGEVDEERVVERFMQAMWDMPFTGLSDAWQRAGTIKVLRRRPVETTGGKLLPFHTQALAAMRLGNGEAPPVGASSSGSP
jgi:hypothetical protein